MNRDESESDIDEDDLTVIIMLTRAVMPLTGRLELGRVSCDTTCDTDSLAIQPVIQILLIQPVIQILLRYNL